MASTFSDLQQKYKSGSGFFFPNDDIDPEQKNMEWCRQYAEAIYSVYMRDRAAITTSERAMMAVHRLYGAGKQPVDKYKPMIMGTKQGDGPQLANGADFLRKGLVNINWEILSVIPKFKQVVLGLFEEIDHSITANSIDESAGIEKEKEIYNAWFEKKYGEQFREIMNSMGIESEQPPYLPDNLEEAQIFHSIGGFKTQQEIGLEEAIEATFTLISDWKVLKRKLIEDALDINIIACRDEYDPEQCRFVTKYVDPLGLVAQYTRENDFRNSKYFGHFQDYTVSQLRVITGMPETELMELAMSYSGYNGNPNLDTWNNFNLYNTTNNSWGYDSFKINVFACEWQTVNKKYDTYRTKNGAEIVQKEKFGKVYNTENRKTTVTDVRLWYAAKWIVGSKVCFEHGPLNDQARPNKKDCKSSYHVYKFFGKSLVETIEPNADMIQLANLKLQNGLAKASPAGIAVEFGSLSNMSMGGKLLSPLDILTIQTQTGTLLYKATTHKGVVNMPGGLPIQPMDVGVGKLLQDCVSIFEIQLNFIRQAIGIDEYTSMSAQAGKGTATEAKIAVSATNNVLKPMYAGIIYIKESLATSLANRIPIALSNNPQCYEAYMGILGKSKLEALKISAEKGRLYYGIRLVAKPNDQDKERIAQSAQAALLSGKNGVPQLTWPEYSMVMRTLETGNVKYADALLNYKIRKREAMEEKSRLEMMRAQGEDVMRQAQSKFDQEKQMETHKAELRIKELAYEYMFKEDAASTEEERKFLKDMAIKAIDHRQESSLKQGQQPTTTAQ